MNTCSHESGYKQERLLNFQPPSIVPIWLTWEKKRFSKKKKKEKDGSLIWPLITNTKKMKWMLDYSNKQSLILQIIIASVFRVQKYFLTLLIILKVFTNELENFQNNLIRKTLCLYMHGLAICVVVLPPI